MSLGEGIYMSRRDFIALIGGTALWPHLVRAQPQNSIFTRREPGRIFNGTVEADIGPQNWVRFGGEQPDFAAAYGPKTASRPCYTWSLVLDLGLSPRRDYSPLGEQDVGAACLPETSCDRIGRWLQ
jgi:hypothetical protein